MAPSQNQLTISRRPPDVEDYIDMLRRYRSWLIGPMFAGLVLSVVVAFLWPDTYVSTATMRITPPQIAANLVPTVVNMQMQQRLMAMQQEIESRSRLSELIQRPSLNLYPKDKAKLPLDDVVAKMNKDIKISMQDVNSPGQGRVVSAFTISFSYPDRFKAQQVVHELVSKFMEVNLSDLRTRTQAAGDFIGETLRGSKERMDALEAQISQFKAANMGRLPEQFPANVAQLQSLQMQLSNTNEALSRLQQQKMQLETSLQNNTTQLTYYQSIAEDQYTVGGPAQTVRNNKLDALNQRLMDARAGLAAAMEQLTPTHPKIKQMQASVNNLEKQFEEEQRKDQEAQANAAASTPAQVMRRSNPAAVKMMQDTQSTINTIKTEIQNTNLKMEEKMKQALNGQIATLNARIESSPKLEQEYAALLRDYSLAKQTYEENHKKQEATDTAKSLEEHKVGENLELLDPPSDPITPSEPNRPRIAAIGTGLGLMIGVVLAGAKEMKNTSLKNLKDVRAYTNLPVLSSIPLLENALLVRRKRRLLWLAWASAILVGAIAMSGSAYYYIYGHTT